MPESLRVCAGREGISLSPKQRARFFAKRMPEFLAAGSRACAYVHGNKVVKFTSHETDAAAALALSCRPVPGVLRVFSVDRVGPWYYAIISKREPRPTPLAEVVQQCASDTRWHEQFEARMARGEKAPAAPITPKLQACIVKGSRRRGLDSQGALAFTRKLSETQARLSRVTGIHWTDVHTAGNFVEGARGEPVIIDLGQSYMPEAMTRALERRAVLNGAR